MQLMFKFHEQVNYPDIVNGFCYPAISGNHKAQFWLRSGGGREGGVGVERRGLLLKLFAEDRTVLFSMP